MLGGEYTKKLKENIKCLKNRVKNLRLHVNYVKKKKKNSRNLKYDARFVSKIKFVRIF